MAKVQGRIERRSIYRHSTRSKVSYTFDIPDSGTPWLADFEIASIFPMTYSRTARKSPRRSLQLRAQQTPKNADPPRYLCVTTRILRAGEVALLPVACPPTRHNILMPCSGNTAPCQKTTILSCGCGLRISAYLGHEKTNNSKDLNSCLNVHFAQYLMTRQVHMRPGD